MAVPIARRVVYPTVLAVGERDPTMLTRVINSAVGGKLNALGSITVLDTTTETRIDDPRIGPQSFLVLMALDAAGAAVVASWWLEERGTHYAVLGHAAAAGDAALEYMVIG